MVHLVSKWKEDCAVSGAGSSPAPLTATLPPGCFAKAFLSLPIIRWSIIRSEKTQFDMAFQNQDRELLLSVKGVGPKVIERLEQIGFPHSKIWQKPARRKLLNGFPTNSVPHVGATHHRLDLLLNRRFPPQGCILKRASEGSFRHDIPFKSAKDQR